MSTITRLLVVVALFAVGCGGGGLEPTDLGLPDGPLGCGDSPAPGCCAGCRSDTDCHDPARPFCDGLPCGRCVACRLDDNAGCGAGTICRATSGGAVCSATCQSDGECARLVGHSASCCSGVCTDLGADPAHCGACGTVCPLVDNGVPACNHGVCGVGPCNAGYGDCDHAAGNGCETRLDDVGNCGACGRVCPGPPFEAACFQGACTIVCEGDQRDCNGDPNDGCEADLTFDVSNCGSCGHVCEVPQNAVAACDLGKCGFRCKLGFADCNGVANDGCEVATSSDGANCGGCGHVCPQGTSCVGGVCK